MGLSIRPKLTLWYIGTVTLLLAFFIGADVIGLRRNLMNRADAVLTDAVEALAEKLRRAPADWHRREPDRTSMNELAARHLGGQRAVAAVVEHGNPEPVFHFASVDPPPAEIGAALSCDHAAAAPAMRTVGGEQYRVAGQRVVAPDGTRYAACVALSVRDSLAAWRQALWEHVLLAVGLIVVVALLGFVVIKRAFRPVRLLTETARTITAEDLSRRVDASGDRLEIGELASTFNEVIARLEDAFDRSKRFSGDVAHELNTPLTVLRGEIELALRKERTANAYRATLEQLLGEVSHLSGIVENLLFLSRADASDLPAHMGDVALDDVVLRAYEELLPLARERSVRVELTSVAEVQARGDTELIGRLVANLLENAIKFTTEEGEVSLALRRDGDRFTLAVADSGIGIPEQELDRVFDRFYRVDRSRSKQSGGAGLGLAIVREIARVHEFDIEVESQPGQRTEFRVRGQATSPPPAEPPAD